MKHKKYLIFLMFLLCALLAQDLLAQGISKEMNVGYIRFRVVDSADEGEGSWGWGSDVTYHDGYSGNGLYSSKGVFMGCKDWNGEGIFVSGHGQWEVDDLHIFMPHVDEEGWTIKRQYRNQPPEIIVDRLPIQDPFPFNSSDLVGAAGMPGTTDGKIWSSMNTDMGIEVRQTNYAYSQKNHWQYMITEYVFKNTGNTDQDEDIEQPNNTVLDWYFLKQLRTNEYEKPMMSTYGLRANEDVVVCYGSPSRTQGSEWDNYGSPNLEAEGYMGFIMFSGEALLFASAGVNDFTTNAVGVSQPHATMYTDVDFTSFTFHSWNMTDFQKQQLLQVMEEGMINVEGINYPEWSEARWGKHGIPLDQRGFAYPNEMEGFGYSASVAYSFGPYDFTNIGDSVKIVVAEVYGSLSPSMSIKIGESWLAGEIDATIGDPVNPKLPPHYDDHPELLDGHPNNADNSVNVWRDQWIYSGLDSLLNNARAAKFAFENNYNVPQAPPAPSVDVNSQADGIKVSWWYPAEINAPGDLAGFNVYRSVGQWYEGLPPGYYSTNILGEWELVHTGGTGEDTWLDTDAFRGVAYYYAVGAFDTGSDNGQDMHQGQLVNAQVLESNFIQNVTISSANKLKPGATTLNEVVVVPNPFNLAAAELQYPGEPNKILFLNVPSECTIRIFTESGDLIKTIDHLGSGDATWGVVPQEHSATDSQQIVVSGLYIAQIETPDGNSVFRKFVIVR